MRRRRRRPRAARGGRQVGEPGPPPADQGDARVAGGRMKLVADAGLWSTGTQLVPTPLVAVLEVSGAVLSWTVDAPAAAATITFTDLDRADWLWRVVGESGHSAVASVLAGLTPDEAHTVELMGVGLRPGAVDPLRRLAIGHWLRRWWPASQRDGIVSLDGAVLD